MKKSLDIFNKINEALSSKKIKKTNVADRLGITIQAFSRQLKQLKEGKGISTETLEVIQEMTGFNFFSF